jgi:hypothetical protein
MGQHVYGASWAEGRRTVRVVTRESVGIGLDSRKGQFGNRDWASVGRSFPREYVRAEV